MTAHPSGGTATIREPLEVVVPRSIEAASVLAERVKGRDAQLRKSFLRRGQSDKPTPMMSMLRGGRGGEVRLKLYLSLLWIAVASPHTATYPARTWAALLGLADPPKLGARRINDALAWLRDADLIELETARGVPPIVKLKEESGSGAAYSLPGAEIKRLQRAGRDWSRHAYDKVPVALWTNGWMPGLSGPSLACLLVLLAAPKSSPDDSDTGAWFSPSLLRDRYNMSDDTRLRGMRGLEEHGLVTTKTRVLARTSLDFQRARNEYTLQIWRLNEPPRFIVS